MEDGVSRLGRVCSAGEARKLALEVRDQRLGRGVRSRVRVEVIQWHGIRLRVIWRAACLAGRLSPVRSASGSAQLQSWPGWQVGLGWWGEVIPWN